MEGMSTAAALLTVEDFLRLPEKEGVKQELCEGVLVEMGGAALGHEIVKSNFIALLSVFLRDHRVARVFSETMFVLSQGEAYIADVSVVLLERLRDRSRQEVFEGAPDLAIEVVSSETAARLETKVRGYLRSGSKAVWVAYPEQRTVRAHSPDGSSRCLEQEQTLDGGDLLPGFQAPISQIFEGV